MHTILQQRTISNFTRRRLYHVLPPVTRGNYSTCTVGSLLAIQLHLLIRKPALALLRLLTASAFCLSGVDCSCHDTPPQDNRIELHHDMATVQVEIIIVHCPACNVQLCLYGGEKESYLEERAQNASAKLRPDVSSKRFAKGTADGCADRIPDLPSDGSRDRPAIRN